VRRVGILGSQLWEQLELPLSVRERLLLNLCNTGPAFLRDQVVVIHDAATVRRPEAFGWAFRMWYRLLMPQLARSASHIVTVSDFARNEVIECFGAPPARTRRIHEGAEHLMRVVPDSSVLCRHGLGQRPFILCVGSLVAYKG